MIGVVQEGRMVLPEMDADIEIRSSTTSLELSPQHHSSTDKDHLSASGKLKFDKCAHSDSEEDESLVASAAVVSLGSAGKAEGELDVDIGLEVEAEVCNLDIGLEVEAEVSLEHGLDVDVGLEVEAEVCADDELEVDENLLQVEAGLEGEAPLSPHGQQPEASNNNSQRV